MAFVLGISFFTLVGFHISWIWIREKWASEKPFKIFFIYELFPQINPGPISRYNDINKQITNRDESVNKFALGAYRFVVGLAKKVVIADQLGVLVNQIYANPAVNNSLPVAWLGAIGYAFQIYFDFSGYTDMAIGLGKMFGFDLVENFNYPYISTSITEFGAVGILH